MKNCTREDLVEWFEFYVLRVLKENMYMNRGYDKCISCLSMKGYAHHTHCSLNDMIKRFESKIEELKKIPAVPPIITAKESQDMRGLAMIQKGMKLIKENMK